MSYIVKGATGTVVIMLLMTGCAHSPDGPLWFGWPTAPDLDTGVGCAAFGVDEATSPFRGSELVFNAHFVEPWELDRICPSPSRLRQAWGCYNRRTGDAYIVGRDWKVYWHEWCHAAFGGLHTRHARGPSKGSVGYLARQ